MLLQLYRGDFLPYTSNRGTLDLHQRLLLVDLWTSELLQVFVVFVVSPLDKIARLITTDFYRTYPLVFLRSIIIFH